MMVRHMPEEPAAPRMRWTAEWLAFIGEAYKTMTAEGVAEAFRCRFGLKATAGQIKSAFRNHGIKCGRKHADRIKRPRHCDYTPAQRDFIVEGYKTMTLRKLTAAFNAAFGTKKPESALNAFCGNHHVFSGRTGRFPKGHVPANKDHKGVHYSPATEFKKGHVDPNHVRPLGAERYDKGVLMVKIAEKNLYTDCPTRFKRKAIVVWERENGPVPKGMIVRQIDGKPENCEPENLVLISKALNARLNQRYFKEEPAEIKPTVFILAKLITKMGERRRKVSHG